MKTILYLSLVISIIAFAFITCEIPGDGCGPFKDRFKVTSPLNTFRTVFCWMNMNLQPKKLQ